MAFLEFEAPASDPPWGNLPPVKAYLLFLGEIYYPGQSAENLVGSADEIEELMREVSERFDPDGNEWWEIIRHTDMALIASSYS